MSGLSGWSVVTEDRLLNEGDSILYGLCVLSSAGGGDVTLYAGLDASSGRKIGRFEGANNQSNPIPFPKPIPCENGLYVDVGSNITEVLVFWSPVVGR